MFAGVGIYFWVIVFKFYNRLRKGLLVTASTVGHVIEHTVKV